MLDHRVYTYLKLCELRNYRRTAEALSMTQPAVTQHIQALESHFGCRFFIYQSRKLIQTQSGALFENYARTAVYNEINIRQTLQQKPTKPFRLGATKTIGDYVIGDAVQRLGGNHDIEFSLVVDNTRNLLQMLDRCELDLALIEGYFDKTVYGYQWMRHENFTGICSIKHPFANQVVPLKDIFNETVILREKGSGTRDVLEQVLRSSSYTVDNFYRQISISSFEMIKKLIIQNQGISFAYESIARSHEDIATFSLVGETIRREFNYVYLKNSQASDYIKLLTGD